MNNSLTIRVLITYAVLVPLAVFMGYMISDPLRYSTFATIGVVLGIMIFPGAGALALVWMIAFYAIIFGVSLIFLAFRLRSRRSAGEVHA